jgi:hypothetical protein
MYTHIRSGAYSILTVKDKKAKEKKRHKVEDNHMIDERI